MRLFSILVFSFLFAVSAPGQNWPDRINGYKLHDAEIVVTNAAIRSAGERGDAVVSVGLPKVVNVGFAGATFDITAEFLSRNESGKVDLVAFKDVMVNGLSLDVEDYRHVFHFKKGKPVPIPMPAKVSIKAQSIPRAAMNELINSPNELVVTGTAFVFGKFKKFGFTFKRVVPVKIDLKFKNPLRSL